ncbi:MAG: ABC transporter ATP-binding protein [Hyphomicrobiales bacterium]|nr:ABC transporter ATP-binding protein [Hyphomicrobiales bacterium]MCP5371115.1 ABC transporter ATP-binding protein [Hyphomicrobiales bacterium]
MSVMAGATALSAWLMEPVVNEIFIAANRDMLWLVGGAVLGTFAVKGAANFAQASIMAFVGLRIIADSQNRLYAHLSRMDLGFFHHQSTGRLLSRFTVDANLMRSAVSNTLTGLGKDVLSLLGLVVVMFVQDWQLAAAAFFVFPVAVYPIARLGRRMRKVTANTQEEFGLFTTLLEQTFQGARVVKAYGMETYERGRIGAIVERVFALSLKAARTRALSSPIMETLGGAAVAVIIVYGGYRVIHAHMDAGSFFSFITALLLAYEPMKRIANLNASLQEGLSAAQRLFQVMDIQPAIVDPPGAGDLVVTGGGVTFEDVHFSYDHEAPALRGITLQVPAGRKVALVGPSGAGKSTVLNLIPRFYDVDSGAIRIDGQDIREVTLASLRAAMALVSQEITLFDDTVRANIAYGRAGASDAEIVQAARNAAAHEFILDLPQGYDTMVGEQGVKLSGGQRQRLAIARAMLRNAPILLLDEATSALDTEAERKVQAALDTLMRDRTTLVIAHRLSTVVDADLICVIEDGRIVEQGSHDELLRRGGAYAALSALQFADPDGAAGAAAQTPAQAPAPTTAEGVG